ncbi:MAG: M48 family metalloprotease [bacterium]|nr:M48 family metalloprotease [bacterium]
MKLFKLFITICCLFFALSCASTSRDKADDTVTEARKRLSHKATEVSKSDVEAEIQFGQELSAKILGKYRMLEDEKLTRYINLIGKGLATYSPRPEIDFKFAILNTDMVNAFAAPGGYIFITKGTLEMIESEAQLAGVLAHEIAHVTERHIVKELGIKGQDVSAGASLASIMGAGTSDTLRAAFTQLVDKASEILFESGLKRENEMESDLLSVMLVSNAGYDPLEYQKLLVRIDEIKKSKKKKKKYSTEILNETHPALKDRVAAIEKNIAEEGLDKLNYAAVRERYKEYVKF